MRCEHNLYFLWDRFNHIGDCQLLEIITTSKEIMSFHDHGVVVFRFGGNCYESSSNIALSYVLVKGGILIVAQLDSVSEFCYFILWIFFLRTTRYEH